jgi:membrane protease subunit (stomatin/prohibitin family)
MAPAFRALLQQQQQQQQQQQRAKSASIIARDLSVASVPPVAGDKTTVANGLPPFLPVLRRSRMAPRFRSAAL